MQLHILVRMPFCKVLLQCFPVRKWYRGVIKESGLTVLQQVTL